MIEQERGFRVIQFPLSHAPFSENRDRSIFPDNPILPDDLDGVLHGGNFYGQPVAFASDALANAVITTAVHAERRIARLCNPRLNKGLPAFLQPDHTGLQSGFMGAQVTASALLAEMRTKAVPAVDALAVAQALDLRLQQSQDFCPGIAVSQLLAWVRLRSPRLTNDRPMNRDIAELARSIQLPGTLADNQLQR